MCFLDFSSLKNKQLKLAEEHFEGFRYDFKLLLKVPEHLFAVSGQLY